MRATSICCSATCPATTCAVERERRRHDVPQALRPIERARLGPPGPADRVRAFHQHLTRTEPDGNSTVLASHHDGKELNSPNDVVVKSDGGIYFTDPTYGRNEYYGRPRPVQLGFRGVYRATGTQQLTLLADDFGQPNGLCFSLDEKRLFVNDTDRKHIRVFDVKPDGALANGSLGGDDRRRAGRSRRHEDRQRQGISTAAAPAASTFSIRRPDASA